MRFDQKFDKVFKMVFKDHVLVPRLDVGTRVARNEAFNCVTLDGMGIFLISKIIFRRSNKPSWSNDGRLYGC